MRRANALVPLLQPHRQADRIADAVSAPGRAHAALDRPQRLGVCVAGLEPRGAQLGPYLRQVLLPRAKQVDALTARDFRVQVVLLCDAPDGEEPRGSDFAAGDARDDRVGAVALDVAQVPVVGVLQAAVGRGEDVLVPQRGKDAGDGGLAQLAPDGAGIAPSRVLVARVGKDLRKGLVLLDHDDVEQIRAGVAKVLAEVVRHLVAHRRHGLVENRRHEPHAAAAPGAGLCARLHRGNVLAGAALHLLDDIALGDVVARADLRVIRQVVGIAVTGLCADDELAGWHVQLLHGLDEREELDVVARVADEHAAEEVLAVGRENVFFVDVLKWVFVGEDLGLLLCDAVLSR